MKKIVSVLLIALMFTSLLAVAAIADDYVSPAGTHVVSGEVSGNVGGNVIVNPPSVSDGGTVTVSAISDDGYSFSYWTFTGEFEWVSGDVRSAVIVIRPLGDVSFVATFTASGGPGPNKDDGNTSPATGYDMTPVLVVMASVIAVSAAAVVITGKRYLASK